MSDLLAESVVRVLTEGYDERVKEIAIAATEREKASGSTSAKNLKHSLSIEFMKHPESRLSNQKALRDLDKDVRDYIKKHNLLDGTKRATSARQPKFGIDDNKLRLIFSTATDYIGQAFPDGDPIDRIHPFVKKLGVPEFEVMNVLDKAFRKYNGTTYNTYLKNLWDDAINTIDKEMLKQMFGTDKPSNPWK